MSFRFYYMLVQVSKAIPHPTDAPMRGPTTAREDGKTDPAANDASNESTRVKKVSFDVSEQGPVNQENTITAAPADVKEEPQVWCV